MSARKKILIVDDDEAVIDLLHAKLEPLYDVVSTNAPERVVKLAREVLPDLIICDVGMPELEGADVSYRLLHDQALKDIPFMYLTELASPADIGAQGKLGGRPAISKSSPTKELLAFIQKMLGG